MTATEAAPVVANATPAAAPSTNAAATPAGNAAPATGEAAKAAPESLLTAAAKTAETKHDYSAIKADGLRAGTLKAFVDALGEHKVEPKVGQAMLDKVIAAVKAGDQEAEAAIIKGWDDETAKDPDFGPDKIGDTLKSVGAALSLAPPEVRDRLVKDGIDKHPAFKQWVKAVGRFVQKATATDTTATGPASNGMSETERWRANNPKTIAGLKAIGVSVN